MDTEIVEPLKRKKRRIPKEVWAAIREGYEQGLKVEDLSRKYGVSEETIVVTSHTGKWNITPRKILKEVFRGSNEQLEMICEEKNLPAPPREVNWVEAAADYRTMIFGKVQRALLEAAPEAPKTWRDIEIADRIARKAAGLESGESTVVQTIIPIGKGDFNVERDVSAHQ